MDIDDCIIDHDHAEYNITLACLLLKQIATGSANEIILHIH